MLRLGLASSRGPPYPFRSPRAKPSGWTRTQLLSRRDSHSPPFCLLVSYRALAKFPVFIFFRRNDGGPVEIAARPLRPSPPKVSTTPSSRAGHLVFDRHHGGRPGQSPHRRARPASIARPHETKELEMQAVVVDVTFKCYGAWATATDSTPVLCDGS